MNTPHEVTCKKCGSALTQQRYCWNEKCEFYNKPQQIGRSRQAKRRVKRAVLVYQAGLANVFAVQSFNLADYGRDAKRLMQADFRACENFARGLVAAGVTVTTAQCNQAGDIVSATWSTDLDSAPFSDKFCPVFSADVENTDNRGR